MLHTSALPALLKSVCATGLVLALAGGQTIPAQAQAKPVRFVVKPMADHFESIDTLSMRFEIKMKGTMAASGKSLPMNGTMLMAFDANIASDQARLTYSGDIFDKMLAEAAGKQKVKLPKGFSMAIIIDSKQSYIETTLPKKMCQKSPQSADMRQLQKLFSAGTMTEMLTEGDGTQTMEGKLLGEENVGGIATKHYALSSAELKRMAKSSSGVRYTAAEVWIAVDGDYLVKLKTSASGLINSANVGMSGKFSGSMDMKYTIDAVNKPLVISVPSSCTGRSA
jgi:hypothetical protein